VPLESVTTRVTLVLKPSVAYSATFVAPGFNVLTYSGVLFVAVTMLVFTPPDQVTVRFSGRLQSWMVM